MFERVGRDDWKADRVKQRRERPWHPHDNRVFVGSLDLDRFAVDRERKTLAVGHMRVVDYVQREDHIARGERLAVRPFHVAP